jgi:catechol 2,3-dioxygenase-like lactoylglutathione lyase family enzyme
MIGASRFNTILYCERWRECVEFYRDRLGLPVTFANDWFVEFRVAGDACLSIADATRATVSTSAGAGMTLTFRVDDADRAREALLAAGIEAPAPRDHPWGARTFFVRDPEGTRLEFWSASV